MRHLMPLLVFLLLTGCHSRAEVEGIKSAYRARIARLQGKLQQTEKALNAARASLRTTTKDFAALLKKKNKRIARLKQRLKDPAIAPDDRLKQAQQAYKEGKYGQAQKHLIYLQEHFPRHRTRYTTKRLYRKVVKELEKQAKLKAQFKFARTLQNVTIDQLRVDARKYRKKMFIRDLACDKPELNQYVYTTGIYEWNRRGFKMFSAHCCWSAEVFGKQFGGYKDRIELRIPRKLARKILVKNKKPIPEDVKNYMCNKAWIPGARVMFYGQVSGNSPVFYLKGYAEQGR